MSPITALLMLYLQGLYHIHLGAFSEYNNQFYRCSDDHLVYTKGLFSEAYLLIDILSPDAHQRAESMDLMFKYIAIANQFRNQF
ncbi:type II toxin-antitoxin system YafO family toxin [Vibrio sp. PP-XX7]